MVHPELDPESVQAVVQRFDASQMLEGEACHDFVGAMCRLSGIYIPGASYCIIVLPLNDHLDLQRFGLFFFFKKKSSAADAFSLSEQRGEEIFDHHLITSLKTDLMQCLGEDHVLYFLMKLAKILQQGLQFLQHGWGEDY